MLSTDFVGNFVFDLNFLESACAAVAGLAFYSPVRAFES